MLTTTGGGGGGAMPTTWCAGGWAEAPHGFVAEAMHIELMGRIWQQGLKPLQCAFGSYPHDRSPITHSMAIPDQNV